MAMLILKLSLFGISTIGSFELIRKACDDKVDIYFLPSLTIAIQVTFLFLAGLLNLLPEVTMGLYLVGFAGILYSLYKEKSISFLKPYINVGYAVSLILLAIFAVYLRGKVFAHYDNFSHWALVVRRMLTVNRYPNFEDTLITFQAYPLGSATYIYYFAKLISTSESVQMLAQSYMMLAAVLPLFSFAEKNRVAAAIVVVSFVNYILLYNVKITNLLVDTLLPLVGICGLLFTYLHCKTDARTPLYFSAFYMVQLVQIKNSGIFFAALIAILLFVSAWKKKEYLHGIICVALPIASLILWQKHCKYVYSSAAVSKHAMTVENFESVFGKKTQEDIMLIFSSLFKHAVSYKEVWIAVGIGALIGALILLVRKELGKMFLKVAVFSLVIYVVYQLGTLAMYIFSMPRGEAIRLGGIERYTKTILVAILYLNMVPAVKLVSEIADKKLITVVAAAGIFASFFVGMYISSGSIKTVVQNKINASERVWIEEAKKEYNVPMYESYCILIPSKDSDYAYYLGKYIFQSRAITTPVVESEETLNKITSKYIFVYDQDNEIINNWIEENYPEQLGNEVIIRAVK